MAFIYSSTTITPYTSCIFTHAPLHPALAQLLITVNPFYASCCSTTYIHVVFVIVFRGREGIDAASTHHPRPRTISKRPNLACYCSISGGCSQSNNSHKMGSRQNRRRNGKAWKGIRQRVQRRLFHARFIKIISHWERGLNRLNFPTIPLCSPTTHASSPVGPQNCKISVLRKRLFKKG